MPVITLTLDRLTMDGIDPRLHGQSQSQNHWNAPPSQYPQPSIKLHLPPLQQQDHQQDHQQPHQQLHHQHYASGPWSQHGANGYHQRPPNALPTNIIPDGENTAPPTSNGQATGDSKRSRACEACRGLKVRCEYDGGSRDCRRCIKAARQCQVTQPSRKRQKKTDTKVAELEKKLEDLRSEIVAKSDLPLGADSREGHYRENDTSHQSKPDTNNAAGVAQPLPAKGEVLYHTLPRDSYAPLQRPFPYATGPALPSLKRRVSSNAEECHPKQQQSNSPAAFYNSPTLGQYQNQAAVSVSNPSSIHPFLMAQPAYFEATEGAINDHPESKMGLSEIIEQHLPRPETAYAAFHHYVHDVAPHTPIVVFEAGINPEHVRKNTPILFLAIVAIAHEGNAKPNLISGIKEILAQQVMVAGRHSVELIQAMLIMSLFYWPAKETANNVYINLASTMTLDTGLGHGACDEHFSTWASENSHLSPAELLEGARTNLGCYAVGKK